MPWLQQIIFSDLDYCSCAKYQLFSSPLGHDGPSHTPQHLLALLHLQTQGFLSNCLPKSEDTLEMSLLPSSTLLLIINSWMDPISFYSFSGFLHVRSSLTLRLNPSFYYLFTRGLAEWDYLPWQGLLHITLTKTYENIYWQTAFPCILVMFFDISDTNNSHFSLTVRRWPPGSSIPNAFSFHLAEGTTEPGCYYHHYFHVSASAITVIHNPMAGHWRAAKLLPIRKIRRKISALKWIYLIPVFLRYTDWALTT